jgi:protein tyrosine/serine phosphatase
VGFFVTNHRLGPKHLFPVTPGVLYRSGTLSPEQLGAVIDRYGIKTVVNLRSGIENADGSWHARQAETLQRKGVVLEDLPMHSGYPPDDEVLGRWLDLISGPSTHPILVHCEYGKVRTGIMVAVYQIEQLGYTGAEAIENFRFFGDGLREPIDSRVRSYLASYQRRAQPPENKSLSR